MDAERGREEFSQKWREFLVRITDRVLRACLPSSPDKVRYDPDKKVLHIEVDSGFKRDYAHRKLPKLQEAAQAVFGPVEVRVGELPILEEIRRAEAEEKVQAEEPADLLVVGVGSGGINALERMRRGELRGVRLVAMDTDSQVLSVTKVKDQVLLGAKLTGGRSSGGDPERGRKAAEEVAWEIEQAVAGAHLVFIACGLGGGTGTGAAPVIAKIARAKGALAVGVVTIPFSFEGLVRTQRALLGMEHLRSEADVLIIIKNDRLLEISPGLPITKAFEQADLVLVQGVRGISDLVTVPGLINLDFADVAAVLRGAGTAVMGTGEAQGENRALKAAKAAAANPLLEGESIRGARRVLLNISGGEDLTLSEVTQVADHIRKAASLDVDLTFGAVVRRELSGRIQVTVIAADFRTFAAEEEKPAPVRPTLPRRQKEEDFELPAFLRRPKGEE